MQNGNECPQKENSKDRTAFFYKTEKKPKHKEENMKIAYQTYFV